MSIFGELSKLAFKTKQGLKLKVRKDGTLYDPDSPNAAIPYAPEDILDDDSLQLYQRVRKGDTPAEEGGVLNLGLNLPKQPPILADGLTPNQQVQTSLRNDIASADGSFSATNRTIGMLDDAQLMPEDTRQMLSGSKRALKQWVYDPNVKSVAGLGLGAAALTGSEDAEAMPATVTSKVAELLANAPTAVRNAPKEQQDKWLKGKGVKDVEIAGNVTDTDAIDLVTNYGSRFAGISPQREALGKEGYFEEMYYSNAMTPQGKQAESHWTGLPRVDPNGQDYDRLDPAVLTDPTVAAPAFHARGMDMPAAVEGETARMDMHDYYKLTGSKEYDKPLELLYGYTSGRIPKDVLNSKLAELGTDFETQRSRLETILGREFGRPVPARRKVYEIQSDAQNALSSLNAFNVREEAANVRSTLEQTLENDLPFSTILKGMSYDHDAPLLAIRNEESKHDFVSRMTSPWYTAENASADYDRALLAVKDSVKAKYGETTSAFKKGVNWEEDAINRQFFTASNKGIDVVDFLITTGDYSMVRSPRVEQRYQTQYKAQIEKQAKKIGAKVEEITEGTNKYLRVVLPASFAIPAFAQEPSEEDKMISQQLAKTIETGAISYEQAEQVIKETVPNPKEQEVLLAEAKAKFAPRPELFRPDMSPEMLTAAVSKVNSMPFMLSKTVGSLAGNEGFTKDLADYSAQLNSTIVSELSKRGHQARLTQEGEVEVLDQESGEWVEADGGFGTSLMNGLLLSTGEIGGGIGGAIAGARAGAALPLPPQGKAVAALGGGVIGGATGVFGGSLADQWMSATILKQKLDEKKALNIAAAAGVEDVIIGLGITGLIKGGKATYNSVVNTVAKAKNAVDNFMLQGALKELENITGLTKAQRQELAAKLEEVSETAVARNEARREIEGVLQTRPGMEILVGEASRLSKTAGFGMLKEIDTRAKSVITATDSMTAANISRVVTDELGRYRMSVKKGYEGIKQLGAMEAQQVGFTYDPATVIDVPKLIDDAEAGITDPSKLSRLDAFTARIAKIGAESDKTFGLAELLDYRLALKQFKESGQFNHIANQRAARMLADIDAEIGKAVQMMPNGNAWQEQFAKANVEYSKMKALEKNVMYKALTKSGASADTTVRALAKFIKAEDGTFMQVLGKLPPDVRSNVEGAVIRHYATKHTAGYEQGFQAVDFPSLARDLDSIDFTTKGGRDLKRVVDKLAKIYQNDRALAEAAGAIQVPKNKTYLATSISGRLDAAAHNQLFSYASRYWPTSQGRTRRLAEAISEVLDNPLNAKSVEKLTAALPPDPAMKTTLQQLSISYAERGQRESYPKVPLYKVYQQGYSQAASQTKYGSGVQYFTDKAAAEKAKGSGQVVEEVLVEPSRYVTLDQAGILVGRELTATDLQQASVVQDLKKHGYLGISDADIVFEFK